MKKLENQCDIRDLKKALKESEQLLRKVIDTIPLRVFWKDRESRYVGCNKTFARDSGWGDPEKVIGKSDDDMIWKSYAEDYRRDDRYVMENGEEKINFIESVVNYQGEERYVRTSKIPLYNQAGEVFGMLGTFEDVTDILELEEALKESEKRYEELTLRSGAVVFQLDKEGKYTYVSPSAKAIFGYGEEDLIGKKYFYDLAPTDEKEQLKAFGLAVIQEGGTVSDYEHTLEAKDGRRLRVMTNGFATLDEKGEVKAFKGIDVDITEIKEVEDRVRYLSYHDQLTGLYNRHFMEEEMLRMDVERNLPLSVIMLDANGLKLVNDAFGHKAGDELLLKMAKVLKIATRSEDLIARTGGDEFLIFLPKTDREETFKIQKRMEEVAQEEKIYNLSLSFSQGAYTKNHRSIAMEDALSQAETRMYQQKNKNREIIRRHYVQSILEHLFIKSTEEKRHGEKIRKISLILGESMGLEGKELEKLGDMGYYHDIGKISLPEELLNKKGALSQKDDEEIKRHSEIGYSIMNSSTEFLSYSEILLAHHERYDGKGYPKGLKGKEIPLWAQILHFANIYDDLTSKRHRVKTHSHEEALEAMEKYKGRAIDPEYFSKWIQALVGKKNIENI